MADIRDFIQSAASNLGVGEDVVGSATGGLLGAIKDNVDGGDFSQLLGSMSGAEDLMSGGSDSGGGIGGMLGGLAGGGGLGGALGAASSMLGGGGGGGGLGALASLAGSGLPTDKIAPLASLFMTFVKSSAGEALVSKLLSQMPELKNLVH